MASLPPVVIMLAAAAVVPLLPRELRRLVAILAPLLVLLHLTLVLQPGDSLTFSWLTLDLEPMRVDQLSLVFGYVFALFATFAGFYAWHLDDKYQQCAALTYAGSSIGAVFAGDLLTLVLFWELMAVSSAYLVWAGGFPKSLGAGMRYLFIHVIGGSLFLGGVLWHLGTGGGVGFEAFEGGPAAWMVLLGFAVNAAIVPLHAWLPDAYPEGSITGTIFLCAFTTKTAVYVLARGFAGWEILLVFGVVMAIYGVAMTIIENDMRRLLSYHIISQVGYMVAAVGAGGEVGVNAASAHAVNNVLYKGLMFMAVGATMYATGFRKMTDLGGIAHKMKPIVGLYLIGALSISAFPLFAGFASKPIVLLAVEEQHATTAVLFLYAASVGTFLSTALKLPYLTWFGPRRDEIEVRSVPWGMYAAMTGAAVLCIAIGIFPPLLYNLLPFPLDYNPYTPYHVIWDLQFLIFGAIAFWIMVEKLRSEDTVTLDTDWFYRKARKPALLLVQQPLEAVFTAAERGLGAAASSITRTVSSPEQAWIALAARTGRRVRAESFSLIARPPLGAAVVISVLLFVVVLLLARP